MDIFFVDNFGFNFDYFCFIFFGWKFFFNKTKKMNVSDKEFLDIFQQVEFNALHFEKNSDVKRKKLCFKFEILINLFL